MFNWTIKPRTSETGEVEYGFHFAEPSLSNLGGGFRKVGAINRKIATRLYLYVSDLAKAMDVCLPFTT